MSDNPSCPQLRSDLEQIKALQQEFEAALDRGRETGDLKPAQALKSQMEQKMAELKEKLSREFYNHSYIRKCIGQINDLLTQGANKGYNHAIVFRRRGISGINSGGYYEKTALNF